MACPNSGFCLDKISTSLKTSETIIIFSMSVSSEKYFSIFNFAHPDSSMTLKFGLEYDRRNCTVSIIIGKTERRRNRIFSLDLSNDNDKAKTRRLIVLRIQSPANPAFAHETRMTRAMSTFVVKLFKSFM